LPEQFVTVTVTPGETYEAYFAAPVRRPAPGVVVLQEIFGLNDFVRGVVERLAAQGFFAIAPDLFWRQQPGIRLDSTQEADRVRARQLLSHLDEARAVLDAAAALNFLRTEVPGCSGLVGALGYCLGGKLSYLMATRTDVDAAVGYYGVGIESALSEAASTQAPTLLHLAGADQLCTPAAQASIVKALGQFSDRVQIMTHKGAGHGFARTNGTAYDAAATARADGATMAFLDRHLRPR
jgi:carboxymethylenebutenolidase